MSSRGYPPKMSATILNKVLKVKETLTTARTECLELRQEASDLQEYSTVKITRATRYLGVLADKARKLDQVGSDYEARIESINSERKDLLNDLLALKGRLQVLCRVRPQFEDEQQLGMFFPDDCTLQILPSQAGMMASDAERQEFIFDRVYGPHIGQVELFNDMRPFIQSVLDGYNLSVISYGQAGSGKTHTLEGSMQDPGVYFRAVKDMFELSNQGVHAKFKTIFHVTMCEIQGEQVHDLLGKLSTSRSFATLAVSDGQAALTLTQERIDNLRDFGRVYKAGTGKRVSSQLWMQKSSSSHLIVTVHLQCSTSSSGEGKYSKLSFVDLAASEGLPGSEIGGNYFPESLHTDRSLSSLGDVLSAVRSQEENIPYEDSKLTQVLADSVGGEAKTVVIVNLSPSLSDMPETMSSIRFGMRVLNGSGNREYIRRWRDIANQASQQLQEKEHVTSMLEEELHSFKEGLREANDQVSLLFSELQRCWKQNALLQAEGQGRRTESNESSKAQEKGVVSGSNANGNTVPTPPVADSAPVNKILEEELLKRDELIERLHQENEKLFDRLTNSGNFTMPGSQVEKPGDRTVQSDPDEGAPNNQRKPSPERLSPNSPGQLESSDRALVASGPAVTVETKTTPAGEYLTAALMDFNADQYDSTVTIADGANKLLMLVLAAVIKAGAAREHEMLAEVRNAVFSFIRKLETRGVLDTMLVSRVRILYIRSLLSRAPELQSISATSVHRFLERAGSRTGSRDHSRNSSRGGNSPARSPEKLALSSGHEDNVQVFKVDLKQEKRSKFSSIVLKLRGIDQQAWHQHVTEVKLKEISDDARMFAVGNKSLAALFVQTPAGELQRQIQGWLSDNFDLLSSSEGDSLTGVAGQLEQFSTAIMDGWMSGLGVPHSPSTDALGQLLNDYTKVVYTSQLQHLKDVAATLAVEEADDLAQVHQLRSALQAVEHKRRKILQQMRSDAALLTKEEGGSPFRNPSTANEDARIASLISLEDILKQVEDVKKEAGQKVLLESSKKLMLKRLNTLSERMPTLLSIDHVCAQKYIGKACEMIEEQASSVSGSKTASDELNDEAASQSGDWEDSDEGDIVQWSVLQFNNGPSTPFIIKCGATSSMELVVKAPATIQNQTGKEIIAVVPAPSALAGLSLDEIKRMLSHVPETFCQLAIARSAEGTRARYTRLYQTLASRIPALRSVIK